MFQSLLINDHGKNGVMCMSGFMCGTPQMCFQCIEIRYQFSSNRDSPSINLSCQLRGVRSGS